jgi:hypothetical protein
MKTIRLSFLVVAAIAVAGCQSAQFVASKQKITRIEPQLKKEKDGLYYELKKTEPYTGSYRAWFENGERAWDGTVQQGRLQGKYSQWFAQKDTLQVEGVYKDGKRDGEWILLYFNGNKEMVTVYEDGVMKKAVYYSEKEEPISHEVYVAILRNKYEQQLFLKTRGSDSAASVYDGSSGYGGASFFTGGGAASDYHNSSLGN